jgi:small subunit ribosomal protein S21
MLTWIISRIIFKQINLVNPFSCDKFAARFTKHLNSMIIVPVKEGENIERALKKFKRKFEKTGVIKELRGRQAFRKPSEIRRDEIKKAVYIQQIQQNED